MLKERHNSKEDALSGTEMQMLGMARTLMGTLELILIGEPTESLAPMIVEALSGLIKEIKSIR